MSQDYDCQEVPKDKNAVCTLQSKFVFNRREKLLCKVSCNPMKLTAPSVLVSFLFCLSFISLFF